MKKLFSPFVASILLLFSASVFSIEAIPTTGLTSPEKNVDRLEACNTRWNTRWVHNVKANTGVLMQTETIPQARMETISIVADKVVAKPSIFRPATGGDEIAQSINSKPPFLWSATPINSGQSA